VSDNTKWRIGTRFYENDIWLHIDARFTTMNQRFICILENGFPADDGKMGGGGEVDDYEEKIEGPEWGIDRGYFYHEGKPGFHYSLMAYRHNDDIPIIRHIMGNARTPGLYFAIYTKRASGTGWQVHVFLHEIGHNLIGRYYDDDPDHSLHNPLASHFVDDDIDYSVHCGNDDCVLRAKAPLFPRDNLCDDCWDAMIFQWAGWRDR